MTGRILCVFMLLLLMAGCAPEQEYDVIIQNGRVIDGTGNPWTKTDIAITGNEISAMGDLSRHRARRVVDASGLYISPGFIDSHSHAADGLSDPELSPAGPLLAQGITTVIVNPDGGGAADLISQQKRLTKDGMGVNVAQLVPHGAVRDSVMGFDDRAPDADELDRMKNLVALGMEAGAVGLSTGLFYAPASYAETSEIIELARVVKEYNGVHQSHIRDESDYTIGLQMAIQEVIDISEAAGIPGIVSHIKALGPNVWGLSAGISEQITQARSRGVEIYADQYPYEASATSLMAALVPRWATAGGRDEFLERLKSDSLKAAILEGMNSNLVRRGGAERIAMRHVSFNPELEGLTLAEIATSMNRPPADAALTLLVEGSPGIVSFNMSEEDITFFMAQPWIMTASDGGYVRMNEGVPHPRNYGSFPRMIRKYVLEDSVVRLESAVRGMTLMPASVYRLPGRGLLRPGMIADIVIFDPEMIRDKATYTDPHRLSRGIEYVFVNGVPAIEEGTFTGKMNGMILKRQAHDTVFIPH